MSKTQEWLVMFVTQGVVLEIMKQQQCSMPEAMELFYTSLWFEKLQNVETGLYFESPIYVYNLYRDRINDKNTTIYGSDN